MREDIERKKLTMVMIKKWTADDLWRTQDGELKEGRLTVPEEEFEIPERETICV